MTHGQATPAGRRACLRLPIAAALLLCWTASAFAQADGVPALPLPAPPQTQAAPARSAEARVTAYNRTVAIFRAPLFGVTAADRATRTERTLNEILAKSGPGEVTVQAEPQGNLILIDGELGLILTEADADRLRGETLDTATEQVVKNLERVIAETAEGRNRERRLQSVLYASIVALLFLGAVWIVLRVRRWLDRRIERLFDRTVGSIHVAGDRLVQTEQFAPLARTFTNAAAWVLIVLAAYETLHRILIEFPFTRPWGEELGAFLIGIVLRIGRGALQALPNLTIAFIIFLLARAFLAFVAPLFHRIETGRATVGWLDADSARPTRRIFSVVVWLFAIVMAYPYLPGAQSGAFQGMSVLIGLMVTVGGSSLFGQAASGMILMYSRTLRVGEYVRIHDQEGTVTELGTFTTKIRTGLGEEVTLPNALVLGTVTKNYSRTVKGKGYVLDTTLTIGYDTPWRQIEAMLIEAARRTPGVLSEPAPQVFQTALADFYPEYRLVCQAVPSKPRPRAEVLAALHANIQDVFNENAVQIMSPHYRGDPAAPKVVPRERWHPEPATPPQK